MLTAARKSVFNIAQKKNWIYMYMKKGHLILNDGHSHSLLQSDGLHVD